MAGSKEEQYCEIIGEATEAIDLFCGPHVFMVLGFFAGDLSNSRGIWE